MKKKQLKVPLTADLQDDEKDKQKMKAEETILDLPEVKDIPGQEHIRPPEMKEFMDVTISSDDEEGKNIPGFDDDDMIDSGTSISEEEKQLLKKSASNRDRSDDYQAENRRLDNTDNDGEPLNEKTESSGKDLDVPGSEEDDLNENIGAEDEENNSYSLGGEKE